MAENCSAAATEVASGMFEFLKAPMISSSGSSWRTVPRAVSVAPIKDTPERTGLVGNLARMGRSMLSPFWSSMIAVCPGVMAGAMISATVGEMSAMFFVVTTTKSYLTPVLETSGMALRTDACQ